MVHRQGKSRHNSGRRGGWSRRALMIGAVATGAIVAGRPMIARSLEQASHSVQEGAIARSPILDQVLYRVDEAFDLHLTAAQKAQLKPILAAAARQAMAVHQDAGLAPRAKRARFKTILGDTRKQVMPIATEAQRAKLEAAYKRVAQARLDLTPEQRAELKPIAVTVVQQVQAVRRDHALTAAEKIARVRGILTTARVRSVRVLNHHQLQQIAGLFDSPVVTNVLTKELNLDAAQQARVRVVVADATHEMQQISGDGSLSAEQIQRRCYHVLGQAQSQVRTVLTADQKHRLDQLATQVNRRMKVG